MARNEEGEFELILGNRQLLSIFFLVVLLLGLCFVGGYALGRSAAPVLNASTGSATPDTKPLVVASATPEVQEPKKEIIPPPTQTAPQTVADPEPEPERPKPAVKEQPKPKEVAKAKEPAKAKEQPKATPTKPEPPKQAAKSGPAGQPIPGRVYLQLSATDKDKADVMVDLLRRRNLPGMAAAISDRPGLYRVLVGPMAENNVNDMRSQLKAAGFPADQAIKRVF